MSALDNPLSARHAPSPLDSTVELPPGITQTEDGRYVNENGRYVDPTTGEPLKWNPLMSGNSYMDAVMGLNSTEGWNKIYEVGTENGFDVPRTNPNHDPKYFVGDDGQFYNEDGEKVYYWSPSGEGAEAEQSDRKAALRYEDAVSGNGTYGGNYYTMDEIKKGWDNDMAQFRAAHPNMDWETYQAYITERQGLIESGEMGDGIIPLEDISNTYVDARNDPAAAYQGDVDFFLGNYSPLDELENEAYLGLMEKYGIKTGYQGGDGSVYQWNGSSYTRIWEQKKKNEFAAVMDIVAMTMLTVVGGQALGAAFQAAGMSSASAAAAGKAVVNLAGQYMTTGELDFGDALLAAALSYGGSEMQSMLGNSGVISDLTSKVAEFGDTLATNGGDVLNAALRAGGMSLVTQLVTEGEIDWKDAAIAAAIGGGTKALTNFLSDVGQSGAESEVLEEIKVTAQHKGTLVGEDMYQLEDGTVIYAPATGDTSVLGNMTDLDLNGDGQLTGNDLQEIQANDYEYKDPVYGYYTDNQGGGAQGVHGFKEGSTYYISQDGVVHQRDDVRYVDGGPDGTYLVRDANGNEFYVRDATFTGEGRFVDENGNYVAVNGYYDARTNTVYDNIEDYTTANGITDNTANQTQWTYGNNPNWSNDPDYLGSRYGRNSDGYIVEDRIYWSLETGYYTKGANGVAVPINSEEVPKEIKDKVAEQQDNKGSATGEDNKSEDTGADNGDIASGTLSGGDADETGGDGISGPSGGSSTPDGNQDSTGSPSSTDIIGAEGGGGYTGGFPDFSSMTAAQISAWLAANGYGAPGGGTPNTTTDPSDTDTDTDPNTNTNNGNNDGVGGDTTGAGGDTTGDGGGSDTDGSGGGGDTEGGTGGDDTGGDETSGGGGNSTDDEGGGGTTDINGGGTGDGSGAGGGDGTGTGGEGDGIGGGDDGDGTGAGAGEDGGIGDGEGIDDGSGGGSGGGTGGGTDGKDGGTGGGSGGGGEGGGGLGGKGGMLSGMGNRGDYKPVWGDLFPQPQIRRHTPYQMITNSLFADLMHDIGKRR